MFFKHEEVEVVYEGFTSIKRPYGDTPNTATVNLNLA